MRIQATQLGLDVVRTWRKRAFPSWLQTIHSRSLKVPFSTQSVSMLHISIPRLMTCSAWAVFGSIEGSNLILWMRHGVPKSKRIHPGANSLEFHMVNSFASSTLSGLDNQHAGHMLSEDVSIDCTVNISAVSSSVLDFKGLLWLLFRFLRRGMYS